VFSFFLNNKKTFLLCLRLRLRPSFVIFVIMCHSWSLMSYVIQYEILVISCKILVILCKILVILCNFMQLNVISLNSCQFMSFMSIHVNSCQFMSIHFNSWQFMSIHFNSCHSFDIGLLRKFSEVGEGGREGGSKLSS
jgi:hypothetical protein